MLAQPCILLLESHLERPEHLKLLDHPLPFFIDLSLHLILLFLALPNIRDLRLEDLDVQLLRLNIRLPGLEPLVIVNHAFSDRVELLEVLLDFALEGVVGLCHTHESIFLCLGLLDGGADCAVELLFELLLDADDVR